MPVSISGTDGITSPTITTTGVIVSGTTVADATAVIRPLVSATAVASTSGTSIDFTSIPSWVKRITVMFSGVSTNSTSNPLVQLGSGSVTTSGYLSTSALVGSGSNTGVVYTTGFGVNSAAGVNLLYGHFIFTLLSGNTWICSTYLSMNQTTGYFIGGGGNVTLSNALDRVRITTVNGTDTFDAGSINILYE